MASVLLTICGFCNLAVSNAMIVIWFIVDRDSECSAPSEYSTVNLLRDLSVFFLIIALIMLVSAAILR